MRLRFTGSRPENVSPHGRDTFVDLGSRLSDLYISLSTPPNMHTVLVDYDLRKDVRSQSPGDSLQVEQGHIWATRPGCNSR